MKSSTEKLNVLGILGGDKATQAEVVEMFVSLLKAVREIQGDLDKKITRVDGDTRGIFVKIDQKLSSFEDKLSAFTSHAPRIEELYNSLSFEFEQLKTNNLSHIQEGLLKLDRKFSSRRQLTTEEIRNALESLIEDERIDKKAIKGLEGIISKSDLDRAIEILDKRTQYLINKTSGGLSSVSHDATLTGLGTPASPLSVVGGGGGSFALLSATGTVNGSNTSFTFTSAPNVIVVDQGRSMQKVSSDGTVNWTGTTSIILSIAPNFDIYAF